MTSKSLILALLLVIAAATACAACDSNNPAPIPPAATSTLPGGDAVSLLRHALANMEELKSYHVEMREFGYGGAGQMWGDFDVANNRASYRTSSEALDWVNPVTVKVAIDERCFTLNTMVDDTGAEYQHVFNLDKNNYECSKDRQTAQIWKQIDENALNRIAENFKAHPLLSSLVPKAGAYLLTIDGKDLPKLTGNLLTSTVSIYITEEGKPAIKHIRVEGRSDQAGELVNMNSEWYWSNFDAPLSITEPSDGIITPVPGVTPYFETPYPTPATMPTILEKHS